MLFKHPPEYYEKEFNNINRELNSDEKFLKAFKKGTPPFKVLLSIYKGNYFRIFKSIFFYFLKNLPAVIRPIIAAALIDLVVETIKNQSAPDIKKIVTYFIIISVLLILNIPFNYYNAKNEFKTVRGVEAGLRGSMARKIQLLSITFHKEMQSGRIQSKIMRDVEAIESMSGLLFSNIVGILSSLIFSVAVTAVKSRIVLLIYCCLVPVAVLLVVFFRKTIKEQNTDFRKEMEHTSAEVMEMVELVPVTKAHALEDIQSSKLKSCLTSLARKGYSLDMVQSVFCSVHWVTLEFFQIFFLALSIFLAFKGRISVGDITLYQTYFTSIVSNISSIINLVPVITKGFESVYSIGDILSCEDVEDNTGKQKCEKLRGEYHFENVTFKYADEITDNKVLTGLNLDVKQGETIALVGESGSGKSTVLSLVIGFYKPDSGKVTVDGVDINDLDLHSYRSHIAMVPQNTILFSGTIRDNIIFGVENVTEEQLTFAIKAANLEKTIADMPNGLDTQVGEHGAKLSGGQRQRISIARAIIRNPDVIIFDEATSALDSVSEKLIQDAIDNLCRNRTTFIVAHRLSTIRNADKIAVINEGHCVEYGTFDELMEKKGEFYKYKILQS